MRRKNYRAASPAAAVGSSDPLAESTLRRRALLAVKLGVTVGLSAWIIGFVDWSQFWRLLRHSNLWIVSFVVFLYFCGLLLSSFKWQQLLAIHRLWYRLSQLLRWYLVASFLNHFLPSSIGGDGYRVYKTWHNERGKSVSVLAILVERISGLGALALLGYGAALVVYLDRGDLMAEAVVGAGSVGLASALVGFALFARLRLLQRITSTRWGFRLGRWLEIFVRSFHVQPGRIALVGLLSFAFHVNKVLAVWLILHALGTQVNPLELTVVMLAVELAGLLPISLGGLGMMEGSFILAMGHFGVAQEVGLTTALLLRVLMVPFYLAGAAFYFVGSREKHTFDSVQAAAHVRSKPLHAK